MATKKIARALSSALAEAIDRADKLESDLLDQIVTLRLVYRAMDTVEARPLTSLDNEDILSARSQLRRSLSELESLYERVDELSAFLSRSRTGSQEHAS